MAVAGHNIGLLVTGNEVTRRAQIVCLLLVAMVANAASAKRAKSFRIPSPQSLAGVLEDCNGARVPDVTLELIQGKTVVKKAVANAIGEYDFGVIQPGMYKVRFVTSTPWCPPVVECEHGKCAIKSTIQVCQNTDYSQCTASVCSRDRQLSTRHAA